MTAFLPVSESAAGSAATDVAGCHPDARRVSVGIGQELGRVGGEPGVVTEISVPAMGDPEGARNQLARGTEQPTVQIHLGVERPSVHDQEWLDGIWSRTRPRCSRSTSERRPARERRRGYRERGQLPAQICAQFMGAS